MEYESQLRFDQPESKGTRKKKNQFIVGILCSVVSSLITGGIVYLGLNNLNLVREVQLNNQISTLQNKINALEKKSETAQTSPTPTLFFAKEVVKEATINKGWKKFTSNGKFVFSTDDWQSYSIENDNASFSIEYPAEWNLDSSVFTDSDGEKIAEFAPGLVVLKQEQKCFDVASSDETGMSELISQTNITIASLSGALRIEKVYYEGGSVNGNGYWYPNSYCLSNGKNAFVMSFYEIQLNSNKRELFNKIISTLKFE